MNKTKSIYLASFLCLLFLIPSSINANCFTVIVGKKASADGSVLFGHNEQNGGRRIINYRYIPRMKYDPGDEVILKNGGKLPQVEETWAMLWLQNPEVQFGDSYFNEWGVVVSSDACPTREDSYEELVQRGNITDGGIGYMLRRLVAQRAKTAREGVKIAGDLLNQFGYTASGRSLIIADPEEAWVLAIARGQHWIAQKCPDDEVVLLPNIHIVGAEADISDTENVLASPGLVDYAMERGWYDPSSGEPFSFKKAFSPPPWKRSFREKYGVDPRQWYAQCMVKGEIIDLESVNDLPFSIKPKSSMTVKSVAEVLRSHLEGTEFDTTENYKHGSPHKIRSEASRICGSTTQEGAVYQLRSRMPLGIGCVVWRSLAAPCSSVLTPWYLCMDEMPDHYFKPGDIEKEMDLKRHFNYPKKRFEFDPHFAFDVFNALENLVDIDYKKAIKIVRSEWDPFEDHQFAVQSIIEETAMKIYEEDKDLAQKFLTDYSLSRASLALYKAKQIVSNLKMIYWQN
ncbi:MAG: dipeptidase [Acidobacteriota bacterium]